MKAAKKQYSDAQIRKIETDAFNHGYVLACANSFNLHGDDVISADTLAQLGISWGAIKRMDLPWFLRQRAASQTLQANRKAEAMTPTPPAEVDVAEGRRLLAQLREGQAITHAGGSSSFEALAQKNADRWFAIHGPALLDKIVTAAEQVAAMRRALEKADAAVNAAYAQADAEFRNHDTRAAQNDKLIREWRAEARSALGAAP